MVERAALDPIVVTGIGLVTPLGTGREEVWRAFCTGDSGVRELGDDDSRRDRTIDPSPLPEAGLAGWVRGFRPRDQIRSPQLRRMDWGSRLLVAAARQAVEDAGLLPLEPPAPESAALVVGSCFGNQRETASYLERVFKMGLAAGQPLLFPNLVLNAAGGYAAIELGIQGPNVSLSEHEASGEAALATAVDLLRSGACEVVCAGGFDELGGVYLDALADRRMLAPGSLPPRRRERAAARGRGVVGWIVPGEGAAMLVLETAAHARRRGARVHAELACARVAGAAAPPYGFPHDAERAARRLLDLALAGGAGESGEASAVSAVLGSADGSPPRAALDAAVVRRISGLQGSPPAYLPFRQLTGDWGAAGALGAALAALAIAAGHLPGQRDPAAAAAAVPERILVVGAARSGVIAPVVLRRAAPELSDRRSA